MSASKPVTPERILQFTWGYAAPLILEAAIRHRVFDVLDGGPQSAEQIRVLTGASARGLRAILNALVGFGLLAKERDRYALVPESATFLVSTKPTFMGGILKHTSSQLIPRWLKLGEVVRTGRPPRSVNQEEEGSRFFQDFVEDLFPFNYASARRLAYVLGLETAQEPVSVLDLAAGSGVWGIALAQASPRVRVTAVDWADVIPVTRRVVERFRLTDRFRFVTGDLDQADFGTGHHIAVFGHILHSEGEARSRALLKKTFAALAPGGTVAIAEFLTNASHIGPANALIFAVNMLVNTDEGDAFSFEEIRGWLEEAGFQKARLVDSPGPSPLILAHR